MGGRDPSDQAPGERAAEGRFPYTHASIRWIATGYEEVVPLGAYLRMPTEELGGTIVRLLTAEEAKHLLRGGRV